MSYAQRRQDLIAAERRIRGYFVNFRARTALNYTPRQLRQAESYVIHVHSEIECYFEDMNRFAIEKTEHEFRTIRRASAPLLFLVSFYTDKKDITKIHAHDIC